MISISFSGMDGAGKSTQCQKLISSFQKLGVDVKFFHMGSQGKTVGSKAQSFPVISKIHRKLRDLSGKGISRGFKLFVGLSYYLIDSWLSHFVHKIKYKNNLVVFDRYFFDFLVIFVSNFPNIPWWVIHFAKILPQSNVTIIMEVSPQIAKQRRSEHSIKELQRYYQLYRRLADILRIKIIDGTKNLAIIEKEIKQHCHPIFEHFSKQSKEKVLAQ